MEISENYLYLTACAFALVIFILLVLVTVQYIRIMDLIDERELRESGLLLDAETWVAERLGLSGKDGEPEVCFGNTVLDYMFPQDTKKVAVFGFAIARDGKDPLVSDELPVDIISVLLSQKRASVYLYDPSVTSEEVFGEFERSNVRCEREQLFFTSTPWEAVKGASAIVVLAKREDFAKYPWHELRKQMRPPAHFFDCCDLLDAKVLERLGYEVYDTARVQQNNPNLCPWTGPRRMAGDPDPQPTIHNNVVM